MTLFLAFSRPRSPLKSSCQAGILAISTKRSVDPTVAALPLHEIVCHGGLASRFFLHPGGMEQSSETIMEETSRKCALSLETEIGRSHQPSQSDKSDDASEEVVKQSWRDSPPLSNAIQMDLVVWSLWPATANSGTVFDVWP